MQEGDPFHDSYREFFSSLPRSSRFLIVLSILDVLLVGAYCIWSVNRPASVQEESLHISIALGVSGLQHPSPEAAQEFSAQENLLQHSVDVLPAVQVTAVFFLFFVIDGIIKENAFELLAAMVLDALVLCRVIFYIVEKDKKHNSVRLAMLGVLVFWQLLVGVRCDA